MDWVTIRRKGKELFGKYKYVCLVLALGMIFMSLPDGTKEVPENPVEEAGEEQTDLSQRIASILTQISGVGKVQVLLTESSGAQTLYQTDEDSDTSSDSQSVHVETVVVSDADRNEFGLVRQVNPPSYLGAIVVCQGADRADVRLNIVEAVSNVTGISTDRITVLKMK